MINEKAIFEIGDIIRVKRNWLFKRLKAEEIIQCYEYKIFKKKFPELCKLAERKNK